MAVPCDEVLPRMAGEKKRRTLRTPRRLLEKVDPAWNVRAVEMQKRIEKD